jgi:hypothetical protein
MSVPRGIPLVNRNGPSNAACAITSIATSGSQGGAFLSRPGLKIDLSISTVTADDSLNASRKTRCQHGMTRSQMAHDREHRAC